MSFEACRPSPVSHGSRQRQHQRPPVRFLAFKQSRNCFFFSHYSFSPLLYFLYLFIYLFIHIQHCAGFLAFSIPLRAFYCCCNDLIAWYVYLWLFSVFHFFWFFFFFRNIFLNIYRLKFSLFSLSLSRSVALNLSQQKKRGRVSDYTRDIQEAEKAETGGRMFGTTYNFGRDTWHWLELHTARFRVCSVIGCGYHSCWRFWQKISSFTRKENRERIMANRAGRHTSDNCVVDIILKQLNGFPVDQSEKISFKSRRNRVSMAANLLFVRSSLHRGYVRGRR